MGDNFVMPNNKSITHLLIPNSRVSDNMKLKDLLKYMISNRKSYKMDDGNLFIIEPTDNLYNEIIETDSNNKKMVKTDYKKGLTDIHKKADTFDEIDRRIIKEVINSENPIFVPESLNYDDLISNIEKNKKDKEEKDKKRSEERDKEKAKEKELKQPMTEEQKKEYYQLKDHNKKMEFLDELIQKGNKDGTKKPN